jgi:hypothetical protein
MKGWPRFRRRLRAFLLAPLLLLVLGFLGFESSLLYTHHRALRFLGEVKKLKVGDSTTADVERFLHEYGGASMKSSDSACSGPNCVFYAVEVYNKPLEYLLRARWAILNARDFRTPSWRTPIWWRVLAMGAYVDNGSVVDIYLMIRSRKGDDSVVEGRVHEVQSIPEGLEFLALRKGYCLSRPVITGGDGGRGITAMIDLRASPEDRQRAFDLNLGCISTLSGCTEPSEIMPSAWEDSQEFLRQHTQPSPP